MGRAIIMHIDQAPWVRGGPPGEGEHPEGGGQLIGDLEQGPWVHVNWLPPGFAAPSHSHDVDEVMYVLEGGLSMGERECGPGTVVYIEAGTLYSFAVGDAGVRFLNIRSGLARYAEQGRAAIDPYADTTP
ncbi:MAG: cupin domain-containing protein [Myxococcota bacterium]|nr:cupin domain-containing protein [Myxococcota bacterium]